MTRPDPELVERVARAISAAYPVLPNYKESLTGSEWRLRYENMAIAAIEASGILSLQRERDELTEALEYIVRLDGKRPDGFTDWQRCVDRIQEVARAALTHVENEGQ